MDFNTEILLRFLLAALWGGLVGAERQYRGKSAGFRTMIMISMGACFFTIMSMLIGEPGNRDRIASNIVTGIGFLGAGVIFRGENQVTGITTAATIWAVAAVGMGIGSGYYFASGCASILILFILAVLPLIESYIDRMNQVKTYKITVVADTDLTNEYAALLAADRLKCRIIKQTRGNNELMTIWEVQGNYRKHSQLIGQLTKDTRLLSFEYY
jgi:putative Mg2+ transporter-C (MgtC) family protein